MEEFAAQETTPGFAKAPPAPDIPVGALRIAFMYAKSEDEVITTAGDYTCGNKKYKNVLTYLFKKKDFVETIIRDHLRSHLNALKND